ncbi:Alpha/Beta hydrolase protein [Xylogone sp. PMI_703]|nr:Alpha/Beta hydrolase protein [Xylogone sp. PMI_703]
MQRILSSEFFNFELLRVLGTAPFGGSDVAECLEAAASIRNNDPESWYKAWSKLAERVESSGEEALNNGDRVAARWAFLRASNYRRSSEFLLHHIPNETRLLTAITQATEDFKKACKLFTSPVHLLDIPFEEKVKLPAYLFLPESVIDPQQKTPVVITTGGFDSIQEELYYYSAAGARTRGYATLIFEGPGQGIVLRRDGLLLRPDWEVVVAAVLDELHHLAPQHPQWNLDLDRVAILGASMGGYFALRAAVDPRIHACVAVDGFYDLGATLRARVPGVVMDMIDSHALPDSVFNSVLRFSAMTNFQTRWEMGHAMLTTGIKSPVATTREFNRYTLHQPDTGGSWLHEIKCPALVTGSRDTLYFPIDSGPRRIYNELTQLQEGQKELWIPASAGQGSLQAKVAALSSLHVKVFGWLDQVFRVQREPRL